MVRLYHPMDFKRKLIQKLFLYPVSLTIPMFIPESLHQWNYAHACAGHDNVHKNVHSQIEEVDVLFQQRRVVQLVETAAISGC